MPIYLIKDKITQTELKKIAQERMGDLIKAVVDVKQKIMAIGGELHADEEAYLLNNGSEQADLWGINIYPDQPKEEWLEFDSMINIRPIHNNRSRDIENPKIKREIKNIVQSLIE
jgi:hypothetical protein